MKSLIFQTATRYLFPILLIFSIYLLLRGHNYPGGGFVGGLAASAGFALFALAYDTRTARQLLCATPRQVVAGGLLLAAGSGVIGLLRGRPFLTGTWLKIDLPGAARLDFGTPLLFDIGVYLVVLGVTLMIIFSLAEEE